MFFRSVLLQLRRWGLLLLASPLCAFAALQPVTQVEGITEYRLPNGLQVLLAPDDSKPTTTVNLTYRVGSRHENYGETGMAHLLEHLLFKGTPRNPLVWAEFSRRGLNANGTTSFDRTNYFASFAANPANLSWYLDWLADAMTHSFIAKKDLVTEMTVVRNEWEMGENSPDRVLWEKAMASHYQWHNYGKTTIGARSDVENVDIGRLQAFYRLYYQPDNATLIVTGKFDVKQVLALVQKHFGAIPRPKRVLPRLYTLEPAQDGERQVTLRRRGGTPQVLALYHTPPGAHPDHAAVELLAQIMGDNPTGRLHKALTEANLAASTWAWPAALHDPGFLALGAALTPQQDPQAASDKLLATVEGTLNNPITAEELERARTRWLKGWEQQFANAEQLGVALSEGVALGDWRLHFLTRDRVKAIGLAEVQRVAAERFLPANRTLGVYRPTEQPLRAPAPAAVNVAEQLKTFKPAAAQAAVPVFDSSPQNIDRQTERGRLSGDAAGIQFALLPKPTRSEAVQVRLVLRGGNLQAFQGQAEALGLMAAMFDKGSKQLSRQQVSDRLDALKTQMSFGISPSEPGAVQVMITSRREHVLGAVELAAQLLREPAWDPAVLDELKRQVEAEIQATRSEPEPILEEALFRHLLTYPRGDIRHVRSFDERLADLKAVTIDGLRQLHQRVVGAGQVELAVVGDFDKAALKQGVQKALGGWPVSVAFERIPAAPIDARPGRLSFATPDKQNAALSVVLPLALNDDHPDATALTMATYLLGNGGRSRLWDRIREREGLSYHVYATLNLGTVDPQSWWLGGAIFAPGNRVKVEAAFREEIERARAQGFSTKELEEGKSGLLGFRALSRAQDAALAASWARNLHLGRTFDRSAQVDAQIRNLTLEQVNAAFRKYVEPGKLLWGVAGDFKE